MDWSNGAKPFVAAARRGSFPNEPNTVAEQGTCVRIVRDWPPDVEFPLETQNPVMGKLALGRDHVALPPDPEWPR